MGSITTSGFLISIALSILIVYGHAKPQHSVIGTHYDGSRGRVVSVTGGVAPAPALSSSSSSSGKIYMLRRKKGRNTKKNKDLASTSALLGKSSFAIPIISEEYNSRYDNDYTPDEEMLIPPPSTWTSPLKQQTFSSNNNNNHNIQQTLPIMVDTGKPQTFRSNIPLPMNPFMKQSQVQSPHYTKGSSLSQTVQKFPPIENHSFQNSPNSRADNFLSSLSSYLPKFPKLPSLGDLTRAMSSTHYTKPGSSISNNDKPPTTDVESSSSTIYTSESKVSPIVAAEAARRASFANVLSRLEKVEEMKAALPPRGSYTPYGERTIIMMKYPGLPERQRVPQNDISLGSFGRDMYKLGGIRPVTITVDDWQTPSKRPIKLKDSDVGVIISQNYILQPDVSMNSHYKYEDRDDGLNQFDMVSQLAKALAERNRIINTYAAGKRGTGPAKEPPFVLVHLETFTKKKNTTTPYGFDEERAVNYANGTIIYPTLDDPNVLASTKFEFEGLQDVENVFDRPLEGYMSGAGMKPIVPLGLVEIQNYLRLMYQVHKDIHDGGSIKVGELQSLAHTVAKEPLPGSRTMSEWEVEQNLLKHKENWMHTSTIGLRSISDYPPPPPKLPIPYPTYNNV